MRRTAPDHRPSSTNSEEVRERIGPPQRLAYGATPIEGFDLYAQQPNAPVNVFIHGGAWRAALAKDYAHPGELFVTPARISSCLDFDDVIEAGDLLPMAEQVRTRRRLDLQERGASFGGDPAASMCPATRPAGISRRRADHRLAQGLRPAR